jgi:predicted lipoprotein with Yx(FWY)xxD motif
VLGAARQVILSGKSRPSAGTAPDPKRTQFTRVGVPLPPRKMALLCYDSAVWTVCAGALMRKTICYVGAILFATFVVDDAIAIIANLPPLPVGSNSTPSLGYFLTAPNGLTLYVSDADTEPNQPSCLRACAADWPPFPGTISPPSAYVNTSEFSLIIRSDGLAQWLYLGKPLYFSALDKKRGDINGEGRDPTWHAAKTAFWSKERYVGRGP